MSKRKLPDSNVLDKWEAREKARIFNGWMRCAGTFTFDRAYPTVEAKVSAMERVLRTGEIEAIGKA